MSLLNNTPTSIVYNAIERRHRKILHCGKQSAILHGIDAATEERQPQELQTTARNQRQLQQSLSNTATGFQVDGDLPLTHPVMLQ
jgi:ribosomal protein L34E